MKNALTIFFIISSAVLLRLFPHVPNFAPIGAMCLFGGVYLNRKYAAGIILLTMLFSDYLLLYIHPFSAQVFTFSRIYPLTALLHSTTMYVYGSFLIIVGIGMWLKKHQSLQNTMLASLSASLLFFLITNFGVWAGGMYSRNLAGLWESYVMGLPFFRATVFGDLFYTGLFFGGYEIVLKITHHVIPAKAEIQKKEWIPHKGDYSLDQVQDDKNL